MNARLAIAIVALTALPSLGGMCRKHRAPAPKTASTKPIHKMNRHRVLLDAEGKILPWTSYDEVARLAFRGLAAFPRQPNGLPTWYSHSRFEPETLAGVTWPHNPAGLNAMLVDSAIGWYAFSGDRSIIELVRGSLDHQLAHGTTPGEWSWASVPFSSADPGAVDYQGADDAFCEHCGRGDGPGHLEPDKIGELGYGYLRFFELTGEAKYEDAALACATALAKHVRTGDETHSPWPFRVHAEDDEARDEYSANVIGAIMLFDELKRLGLGSESFTRARDLAWQWMMTYPMQNDAWAGYFEDIPIYEKPADNPNQYSPLQTAHYLLDHPELDPAWREHVPHLLAFVRRVFAADANDEKGMQFGAEVLSEQMADMAKMASHTARYGSIHALWFEKTGDDASKEKAARSLAWATYWCDEKGIVKVGADDGEGWWFSDGYGDYIRHFVTALGAVPEWAPAGQSHLLRSTTVITRVAYEPTRISYAAFDPRGEEVFRLARPPASITIGGQPVTSYVVRSLHGGGVALTLSRSGGGEIVIDLKQ